MNIIPILHPQSINHLQFTISQIITSQLQKHILIIIISGYPEAQMNAGEKPLILKHLP